MDSEIEVWKTSPSFPGYLEISNLGRIRTVTRYINSKHGPKTILKHGQLRAIYPNRDGYVILTSIRIDGKWFTNQYVHRLVAEAFIPNTENKPEVNHKDSNKANNNVNNLEWVTMSENQKHRYKYHNSSLGSLNAAALVNEQDVINIRSKHSNGVSVAVLANEYGMSTGGMYDIVRRKNWKHVK